MLSVYVFFIGENMKNFKHLNSWALSLALLSLPLFSTTVSGADEVEEVVAVGSRREAR